MKKYLFGLGAMLVGAGLMFVLMHGEVSADSSPKSSLHQRDVSNFYCETTLLFDWDRKKEKYVEIGKRFKGTGINHLVKECRKEDPKENTTCYVLAMQDNPSISCVKG
jgi:hypothetical protein